MVLPETEVIFSSDGRVLLRQSLPPGDYVIGRGRADLKLEDPGISPQHARLVIRQHDVEVADLGSAAGTYVNGQPAGNGLRILPSQKVYLGKDVILETRRHRKPMDPEESLTMQAAMVRRLLPEEFRHCERYAIREQVGQGGMGTIFVARDNAIRRLVAMKLMRAPVSEAALGRFVEEAQITGQLEHPNIVPIHELGVDEFDQLYYTMKYVRGQTLKDALSRVAAGDAENVRRFPLSELLAILLKVSDAVAFAHSRGVIHRDLKPENIMLGEYGEVLVMDWGLAAARESESVHSEAQPSISLHSAEVPTGEALLLGTPHYMAPEQARGEMRSLDGRCDIYALGGLLYTTLALEAPVEGETAEEVLENVRAGRTRTARAVERRWLPHVPGGRAPESLLAVARKAMAFEKRSRYGSVSEFQDDIRAYLRGFATGAEAPGIGKTVWLAFSRNRREAVLLALCLTVLIIVGALAFLHIQQQRARADEALAGLRDAAPAFVSQARWLAAENDIAGALQSLEHALRLDGQRATAWLAKGELLQAQLQFGAAASAFRMAEARRGEGEARAAENAEICEALDAEARSAGKVSRESLLKLLALMTREERPAVMRAAVARIINHEGSVARDSWLERLAGVQLPPGRPLSERLTARADGLLVLDLRGTNLSDLGSFDGIPVAELDLSGLPITTIEHARGLPLERLNLSRTGVSDLAPLAHAKLAALDISDTAVTDLRPLAGLPLKDLRADRVQATAFDALKSVPLEVLSIAETKAGDLSFLQRMPLRRLCLAGCNEAMRFSTLLQLPNLEALILPNRLPELSAEELRAVSALRNQSSLRQIEAFADGGLETRVIAAAEGFWAEWGGDLKWMERLRRVAPTTELVRLPDRTWELTLRNARVTELPDLSGARLRAVDLFNTPVTNIRALAEMPLQTLDLRLTRVTDLTPLRGMPLRELLLWQNPVQDFSPLKSLTELELLDLSDTPFSDLRVIGSRKLRLLRIGSTKVSDLSPLAGMPLEKLHCDSIPASSVAPLLQCRELRWIVLPADATDAVVLRELPKLERISRAFRAESEPTMTASEFWAQEFKRKHE
jgi:Leucine-rich repeat (LRR) protein/tRNA A-37 threonylcarbamoyl transferase component Bud32